MTSQKQIDANRKNAKKGGRKPGYAALQAEMQRARLCEMLAKEWVPIVKRAIDDAKKGDKGARDWLTDQGYGKPVQPTTVSDPNGDPLFKPSQSDRDAVNKALDHLFKQ